MLIANKKKLEILDKRIEFILESDLSSALNPQDKVKQSLAELMKELEQYKREITTKSKEIDRLNEKINKLNAKNERLTKKISTLKAKNENQINQKIDEENKDIKKDDPLNLLIYNTVPNSLEFRINSLKTDYASKNKIKNNYINQ